MTDDGLVTPKRWAMVGTLGPVWGAAFRSIEIALQGVLAALAGRRACQRHDAADPCHLAGAQRPVLSDAGAQPWSPVALIGLLSNGLPFMLPSGGSNT